MYPNKSLLVYFIGFLLDDDTLFEVEFLSLWKLWFSIPSGLQPVGQGKSVILLDWESTGTNKFRWDFKNNTNNLEQVGTAVLLSRCIAHPSARAASSSCTTVARSA